MRASASVTGSAHASIGGKIVRFYGSRVATAAAPRVAPGTVVAIDADDIQVAATSGTLRFSKLSLGGPKLPASEAALQLGLKIGNVL